MLSTAGIYFVAAAQESAESEETEGAERVVNDNDLDNDMTSNGLAAENEKSDKDNMATQVETAFFTIVGMAYAATSIWILKVKGRTNIPYIFAIVGSIAIIGLYVASRTMDLPIVGLQDDVGTIDITSKVLQVGVIAVAASIVNSNKELVIQDKAQRRNIDRRPPK